MPSTLTSLFSYSPPCATFLVLRCLGCGLASGKKLCAPRPACVNYQGSVVWRAASSRTLQILQGWCGAASSETFAKPARAFEPQGKHQNLNSQHGYSSAGQSRAQGGSLGIMECYFRNSRTMLSYEHRPPHVWCHGAADVL